MDQRELRVEVVRYLGVVNRFSGERGTAWSARIVNRQGAFRACHPDGTVGFSFAEAMHFARGWADFLGAPLDLRTVDMGTFYDVLPGPNELAAGPLSLEEAAQPLTRT